MFLSYGARGLKRMFVKHTIPYTCDLTMHETCRCIQLSSTIHAHVRKQSQTWTYIENTVFGLSSKASVCLVFFCIRCRCIMEMCSCRDAVGDPSCGYYVNFRPMDSQQSPQSSSGRSWSLGQPSWRGSGGREDPHLATWHYNHHRSRTRSRSSSSASASDGTTFWAHLCWQEHTNALLRSTLQHY